MERPIKGSVVVLPFPFTDLTDSKRRPALILHNLKGENVISCVITSQSKKDEYSIELTDRDFKDGGLNRPSFIRVSHIFTVDKRIILYSIGKLKQEKINEVMDKICEILTERS